MPEEITVGEHDGQWGLTVRHDPPYSRWGGTVVRDAPAVAILSLQEAEMVGGYLDRADAERLVAWLTAWLDETA